MKVKIKQEEIENLSKKAYIVYIVKLQRNLM